MSINNIQVNFDDGNGFVAVSLNTTKTVFYSSIGTKKLVYKITFSNGTVRECYNDIVVDKIPQTNTTGRYAPIITDPITGNFVPEVVINSPTNAHDGADLYIRRSISNPGSNTNPTFLRPLIVLEGFDITDASTLFGNGYNYDDFRTEIRDLRTRFSTGLLINGAFDEHLDDIAGYDLIFVNYHNGVDNILRNALMLQQVIEYVNARKAPGALQNVVMGISMGGLVSRYCLAQMVKSGQDPQTRLLITHDSPHRGANVPLALQHLLQGIRKEKVRAYLGIFGYNTFRYDEIVPQLLQVNNLLNAPATEQQLLVRVVDDMGTVAYNTFLDGAYRTMVNFDGTGFTQPYRMIATSQGSQCGVPVMQPYANLANFEAEGYFSVMSFPLFGAGRIILDMHALPNLGESRNILNFRLMIRIKIGVMNLLKTSINIQKNNPTNLLPLDGVAAGTRALGGAVPAGALNVPTTNGFDNLLILNFLNINYYNSLNSNGPFIAPTFSFVPTTSALDIDNFSAVNSPYIVAKTGLNGSRMNNYIAQERRAAVAPATGFNSNLNHTDFFDRACHWLYNEMEGLPDNLSCTETDECLPFDLQRTNTSCEGIHEINVTNVRNTVPVTYTVSPPSAAIIQPVPTNKIKVFAANNTPYTINANFTYCGTATTLSQTYTNSITARQDVTITDNDGTTVWCGGTNHSFSVNDFGEGATYTWSYGPEFTLVSSSPNN